MSSYSLVTKTQQKWGNKVSGDLNKLNIDCLYYTDNEYGFPEVSTSEDFHCKELISFNTCKETVDTDYSRAIHFFIDDYKFEKIWARPRDFLGKFKRFGNIVSPTFSIWSNQPYALNVFNMYRSRWCTRFYQDFGINVLVDVRWADESSYSYCFSGIKKNTPVIVNTVGTKRLDNRSMFVDGFYEMLRVLEPSDLYVYGEYMPVNFDRYFDSVTYFESFWKQQRDKIKMKEINNGV